MSDKELLDKMQNMIDQTLEDVFDRASRRLDAIDPDTAGRDTGRPAPRATRPAPKKPAGSVQAGVVELQALIERELGKTGEE